MPKIRIQCKSCGFGKAKDVVMQITKTFNILDKKCPICNKTEIKEA